ncbi:hypothetical protein QQ045_015518 [Rhodiola kirilowii]
MSQVLSAKYCKGQNILHARMGTSPSHIWRGVMRNIHIFLRDSQCKLCGCNNETTLHVVRDSWWAQVIYRDLGLDPTSFARLGGNPADWVWSCRASCSDEDFGVLMFAAWVCWKNRNRVWHGQNSRCARSAGVVGRSLLILPAIHFCPRPLENANIGGGWLPPEAGCIKINSDGSWDTLKRMAGIGIVARDHLGKVL